MTLRTRTAGNTAPAVTTSHRTYYYDVYDIDGRTTAPYTGAAVNFQSNPTSDSRSMTDIVTSSFKKRSSKGEIILSPMSKQTSVTVDYAAPLNFDTQYRIAGLESALKSRCWRYLNISGSHPISVWGSGVAFPNVSLNASTVRSKAITAAHANISLSEMQLIASLGEARETLQTLTGIFKAVRKILIKRDIRYIRRTLQDLKNPHQLADLYMKVRYELRPLYYDAMGVINVLQATRPTQSRQTFRGFYQDEDYAETTSDVLWLSGHLLKVKATTAVKVQARAGVLTDIEFLGLSHLCGLYEIPQSAWELVPLSFVVDWFFNVGKVIASWSPKPGFKVLGSWVTTETIKTQTRTVEGFYLPPSKVWDAATDKKTTYRNSSLSWSPVQSIVTTTTEREINPPVPLLPSFDVRLDFYKLLDLAIIFKNLI